MDLIERANIFATAAHTAVKQLRRYTGDPYIIHPRAVAEMVAGVMDDPETIAAALLHDVVEDTGITLEDIREHFGEEVHCMVEALTDCDKSVGNRATRKSVDRGRLALADGRVHTIKLADLIHNHQTISQYDPNFYVVYRGEGLALLEVLTLGHPKLLEMAQNLLAETA